MYKPVNLRGTDFSVAQYLTNNHLSPPLIVGGVGGSGTRLITQLLKTLDLFMGQDLNASEDALAFVSFYERYINPYLMGESVDYRYLADELLTIMIRHRSNSANAHSHWGWKNPRSIYLLPIFDALIPGLHFVHVVRDGVAMSTSDNQTQLDKHGACVLQDDMQALPRNQQSLLLWANVNNAAADYGKTMGERYFLVRYEDVCENPDKAFSAIADALGIRLPSTWDVPISSPRMRQNSINQDFSPYVAAALKRFGYPC
jgi:hypothetical protein